MPYYTYHHITLNDLISPPPPLRLKVSANFKTMDFKTLDGKRGVEQFSVLGKKQTISIKEGNVENATLPFSINKRLYVDGYLIKKQNNFKL